MISPENEQSQGNDYPSPASLIIENEILMMKLNAEFGAAIFLPEERVSPEIENHFLRSVYEFEQKAAAANKVETIWERIGRPVFIAENLLNEEQVQEELGKVLDQLFRHKIVLDLLAVYPDRVIYRFLTNEFVHLEVDGIGEVDCYIHFCYEDFVLNHDYDLRQAAGYFAAYITGETVIVPQHGLFGAFTTSSGLVVGYKEAIAVIDACLSEFERRRLIKFEIREVNISGSDATVLFETAYEGMMTDGEKVIVDGEGRFDFVYADHAWWITSLRFPGIVI